MKNKNGTGLTLGTCLRIICSLLLVIGIICNSRLMANKPTIAIWNVFVSILSAGGIVLVAKYLWPYRIPWDMDGMDEEPETAEFLTDEERMAKLKERYDTLRTYIRVCRPVNWLEVLEFLDLSKILKLDADQGMIDRSVIEAELKVLVTKNDADKIKWNPETIYRAAMLLNSALQNETLPEWKHEMLNLQFTQLEELFGNCIGYRPLLEMFKGQKNIVKSVALLQQ